MKRVVLLSFAFVLFVCFRTMPANAFGVGLFGNFNGGELISKFLNYGGGFVMDSNLAQNRIFNYRLEFGVSNCREEGYKIYSVPYYLINPNPIFSTAGSWHVYRKIWDNSLLMSTVHYFGFGVFRNNLFRLWLGPQFTIGGLLTNRLGVIFGMGFAVGLNINIGDMFTMAITGSGRFLFGAEYKRVVLEYGSQYSLTGFLGGDGMVTLACMYRVPGDRF